MRKYIRATQILLFPVLYMPLHFLFVRSPKSHEPIIDQRLMIIANHISFLDPFLITGHLRLKEVVRVTPIRAIMNNNLLYRHPFAPLLILLGCYPSRPRRGKLHGLKASMAYAEDSSLLFFPEGGIKGRKYATRLRSGAAVISNEKNMNVLPIFIRGGGLRREINIGNVFPPGGLGIEEMMNKVYDLEQN